MPTKARTRKPRAPTREALLAQHAEWRAKRNAAPLGSEPFRAAVAELERIEVEIARIDREADPPRV
jgi:hypothetical protein